MWLILSCLAIGLIITVILNDWKRPAKFPPGPQGLPIIGNVLDMKKLINETKIFAKACSRLAEVYGPVVGLRLGLMEPVIIVSGREAVTEMLGRPEFDGRPDAFMYRYRTGGEKKGVIFTDGNLWHDQRKFTVRALKQFGFGKISMEDMILNDAFGITKLIEKMTEQGPITNLDKIMSLAVVNSLWAMLAGSRLELDEESPKMREILSIIHDMLRNVNVSGGVINQFPFLRYVCPGLLGFTLYRERLARVTRFFDDEVAHHKESKMEGELRDFADVYLAKISAQKENSASFDEGQLRILMREILTAGFDTTNNTLGFVIAYLAVNPNIQKKLHDEIDTIIGRDAAPSLAQKNRCSYLNATLAEVSRMANITPTTLPHRALTDTTLLGFEIKKNYILLPTLTSLHMDKNHWGDPDVFRPERFINDEGEFFEDPWLIPFGLGRRRCLGENFAKASVFLIITCLLQKFHFSLPADHPPLRLEGLDGLTISPPKMSVIATKRC